MLGKRDSECCAEDVSPKKDRKDEEINVVDLSDEDDGRLCIDESPATSNCAEQALDLSMKTKKKVSSTSLPSSLPHSYSNPNILRPSVIHSKELVKPSDGVKYDVEEHFRKSLCASKLNEPSSSPPLKSEESQRPGPTVYTTGAEVEDHFARALGDRWQKIQKDTDQSQNSHVTSVNVSS